MFEHENCIDLTLFRFQRTKYFGGQNFPRTKIFGRKKFRLAQGCFGKNKKGGLEKRLQ